MPQSDPSESFIATSEADTGRLATLAEWPKTVTAPWSRQSEPTSVISISARIQASVELALQLGMIALSAMPS